MLKKVLLFTVILSSIFMLVGCSKDPLDTYRNSAIEILEDYRVAKLTNKEAYEKLNTLANRISTNSDDLQERIDYSSVKTTISYIASRLYFTSSEPTDSDISGWIQEIKSTKK